MQKWSPEAFAPEAGKVVVGAGGVQTPFAPLDKAGSAEEPVSPRARFRREAGFATEEALMSHLTREERATVFELVEVDVAASYEARFEAQEADFRRRSEAQRQALAAWADSFQEAVNAELRDLAAGCVELSLQLAHKILRAEVELDSEALIRALSATLHKVPAGHPLNVTVHPDDAVMLQENPEIQASLNIGSITADRRIEKGGCRVESGGREWDATLSGQLEALARMIREQVAVAPRDGTGPIDQPFTGGETEPAAPKPGTTESGGDDAPALG